MPPHHKCFTASEVPPVLRMRAEDRGAVSPTPVSDRSSPAPPTQTHHSSPEPPMPTSSAYLSTSTTSKGKGKAVMTGPGHVGHSSGVVDRERTECSHPQAAASLAGRSSHSHRPLQPHPSESTHSHQSTPSPRVSPFYPNPLSNLSSANPTPSSLSQPLVPALAAPQPHRSHPSRPTVNRARSAGDNLPTQPPAQRTRISRVNLERHYSSEDEASSAMARRRARRLTASRGVSPGPSRQPSRPPTPINHPYVTHGVPVPVSPVVRGAEKFVIKTEPEEVDGPALLRAALGKASPTLSLSPTPSHSPSPPPTFPSGRQLLAILTCPKCDRLLREPTTLACGHAVCLACAVSSPPPTQLRAGLNRATTAPSTAKIPSGLVRSGSGGLSGAWLSFGGGPTPSPPALQNVPFDLPQLALPASQTCGRAECSGKESKMRIEQKVDFILQKVVSLVQGSRLGPGDNRHSAHSIPTGQDDTRVGLDSVEVHSALECAVCFQLLNDPATGPCGHTFCGLCLLRAHDHMAACPLCRAELPVGGGGGRPNLTLQGVLDVVFEGEMRERRRQMEEEAAGEGVPIFVCTLSWPNLPTFIHVFEPRYRLMLRRVLDSPSRSFGMVLPARRPGEIHQYGTMLKVQNCRTLEDGRSIVETIGTWRFRVLDHSLLDGYTVGRVERIEDISPDVEVEIERQAVGAGGDGQGEPSTEEMMETCLDFVATLRSGSAPWVVQRLNNTIGPMPTDPPNFTFWMGEVMPVDDHVKAALLQITSPRERLRLITFWIEQFKSSWWFTKGCEVM